MENLFFYPTINEQMCEDAGCYCGEYTFDYFSDESYHKLIPKKGKNAYKFIDDTWKIENDGLRITRQVTVEYPQTFQGKNGVACKDAELGICIIWNNKKLSQMGYIMPETIKEFGNKRVYNFKYIFPAGQIKGDIYLETIIYIKKSAVEIEEDEKYLMNEAGVSLGTIDEINLNFENNHIEFPIVEVKEANQPLWWLELTDWEDPRSDPFNEDYVCLYLNSYYDNCPKAGEGFDNVDLLVEIVTTAYLMIINKIDEMGFLNDTLKNVGLQPGSISKMITYFYDSAKVPLKFDSMTSLHKSIHQCVENLLKGGSQNDSL